jgi:hypothetical protein
MTFRYVYSGTLFLIKSAMCFKNDVPMSGIYIDTGVRVKDALG